ncbi:MAG: hypothetical protein QXQ53_07860 [Candidatus Methanosuratincola sp.]
MQLSLPMVDVAAVVGINAHKAQKLLERTVSSHNPANNMSKYALL